jgi:putative Mg2+ transporter-C (MgtC) family protein
VQWWLESWLTRQSEVSDLTDLSEVTRLCTRLLAAIVRGGVLGYEWERTGSPTGLRTHLVVALGSALFVFVPCKLGQTWRI